MLVSACTQLANNAESISREHTSGEEHTSNAGLIFGFTHAHHTYTMPHTPIYKLSGEPSY